MGDAILCTPALRAVRRQFNSCRITLLANATVRELLSPSHLNDRWLEEQSKNPFAIAKRLRPHGFTHAILFKNSFASALAVFLAGIPARIGYAREGRGVLLTDKLHPPRQAGGRFKPLPMTDYYLAIASWLGASTADETLELLTDPQEYENVRAKLPEVTTRAGPIVIIIPGGAFGPSKFWPAERFAQTADWLIDNYKATVIISVTSTPPEKRIAEEICAASRHKLFSLAETPLSLGELKALFSKVDLVISNDTGPRHIATASGRKVITLFGPNDPAWTDTGCDNEIQIVGNVPCAPCQKPVCKAVKHLCMQAITVEMVCDAAKKLLENTDREEAVIKARPNFIETSESFFVDPWYEGALSKLGLISIEAVFSFSSAKNLYKNNLARYRSRLEFEIDSPSTAVFLKRYDKPPISVQLKNWLRHRARASCGLLEFETATQLATMGINTPRVVSYGEQWGTFFEERSFIITERIPNGESLERKVPECFKSPATVENLEQRTDFIAELTLFVKKFHETGYRHRDLYLSHIFYGDNGRFHLIDLARAFRPIVLRKRFQIKDIAQLHYSAPAEYFSWTDRLRFYLAYVGQSKLARKDKVFIRRVLNRAKRMARHDRRHNRPVPFAPA